MKSNRAPEEPCYFVARDAVRFGTYAGAERAVQKQLPVPSRLEARCTRVLEGLRTGDGVSHEYISRVGTFLGGPAVIFEMRATVYPLTHAKVR